MRARVGWGRLLWLAWTLALLAGAGAASAHKASDAYLSLDVTGAQVRGQLDVALRDIDVAIGLDGGEAGGDGQITWGELRQRRDALAGWALRNLSLTRGTTSAEPCRLAVGALQVDQHTDGTYAVLPLTGSCPQASGPLRVGYRLLFEQDAMHRGLVRLTLDGTTQALVFSPERPEQRIDAAQASRWTTLGQYIVEGMWHIWLGYDHALFLVALLLPAVLVREGKAWRGVAGLGGASGGVLAVITAFTAAHALSLSLATFGWISLPSRLVESAIALTVVLAAANNLYPIVRERRWLAAFGFGLIHGFGFASVLAGLGLSREALALALVGFNIGVELGQIALVALFLPLAFRIRDTTFYRRGVLVGGSLLTLALALVWLVERVFDLRLITP
ncbi:HupE/UreJ family protein [Leptothrix discophora]|uniref:HupE/UreJ family protein n=1 Tax=Leptothrix discophora TaxID=89 RepID=A0ABT9G6G5_LEPDI|nr:HupE/UreJ family protein [Leptothrix discophora]MDP4301862.1 HupE/UreJ family protein [Leptothrix discophora]